MELHPKPRSGQSSKYRQPPLRFSRVENIAPSIDDQCHIKMRHHQILTPGSIFYIRYQPQGSKFGIKYGAPGSLIDTYQIWTPGVNS